MVGWHHQLDGHEFEQAPGDGEGQGSLVCLQTMGSQRVGCDLVTEQQQNVVFSRHLTPTPRLSAYAMSLSFSKVSGAIV